MKRIAWTLVTAALLAVPVDRALAQFPVPIGGSRPLNTNAENDVETDATPHVATDGQGNWVAVWQSDDLDGIPDEADADIVVARSNDNGATWSDPQYLGPEGPAFDITPHVATDNHGTWLAVWNSVTVGGDLEVVVSRSTNNGAQWTAPQFLDSGAPFDAASDLFPRIAAGDNGTWIGAWVRNGETLIVARSTTGGQSWSLPQSLGSIHYEPQIATDRDGTWVVAWSFEGFTWISRSTDDGQTWDPPEAISSTAVMSIAARVGIATDLDGTWIIVFAALDLLDFDNDVFFSRSTDNGNNWTSPSELDPVAPPDAVVASEAQIAVDGAGNWVVVWTAGSPYSEIKVSASSDAQNWTSPQNLIELGQNEDPRIAASPDGHMVIVWQSRDSLDDTIGDDPDILTVGVAFSSPDCIDEDGDGYGFPGLPGCPAGAEPDCDDGNAQCTTDCADVDGDGYCSTTDCDDLSDLTHPGAWENCDGLDNDCDQQIDEASLGELPDGTLWAHVCDTFTDTRKPGAGHGLVSGRRVRIDRPRQKQDN